jgi:hypothetical protein
MLGRLTSGLVLAVSAALVIGLSDLLGLDLQPVALLGASLGGALAFVPHTPDWGRLAGFLVGFLAAWVGYALRAAVLPDAAAGRAVAALIVIVLVTVVAAATAGRLPLWSGLIGVAALVGAYEELYTSAPSQFVGDSMGAATAILLAVAVGYLVASLTSLQRGAPPATRRGGRSAPRDPDTRTTADDRAPVEGVESLMTGDRK